MLWQIFITECDGTQKFQFFWQGSDLWTIEMKS